MKKVTNIANPDFFLIVKDAYVNGSRMGTPAAGWAFSEILSFLDTLESGTKEEKKVPTRIYLGSKYSTHLDERANRLAADEQTVRNLYKELRQELDKRKDETGNN